MRRADPPPDDEADELAARLERLGARAAPLEAGLADLDHEARRLGERLERADRDAGRALGLLRESRALFEKELAELRAEEAVLRRRYAEITGEG